MSVKRRKLKLTIYLWGKQGTLFGVHQGVDGAPDQEDFICQLFGLSDKSLPSEVLHEAALAMAAKGR